ncbi:MAG TPA: hypothetical protein VMZ06_09595 [Candidatus Bathyarchaeia archaeon]|nr:hypothetical protein [Candidatus Bathyarchaeia archaeon]
MVRISRRAFIKCAGAASAFADFRELLARDDIDAVQIAMQPQRKLRWDPKIEQFIGDPQANGLLARPMEPLTMKSHLYVPYIL